MVCVGHGHRRCPEILLPPIAHGLQAPFSVLQLPCMARPKSLNAFLAVILWNTFGELNGVAAPALEGRVLTPRSWWLTVLSTVGRLPTPCR